MDQAQGVEGVSLGWAFHHQLNRRALETCQDMERLRAAALLLLESHMAQRTMIRDLIGERLGIKVQQA